MKPQHTFIRAVIATLAAAVLATGCEKEEKSQPNSGDKLTFDSWIHVNYPDAPSTALGSRILDETAGTGSLYDESCSFILAEYTITGLDGTISAYTNKETAQQLGLYNKSYYYGPKVIVVSEGATYAGLRDAIKGMRIGGTRKVAIPSWLLTYDTYGTAEEYLKHSTSNTSSIYTITLVDQTDDILKYQVRKWLEPYVHEHMHGVDSTYYGGDEEGYKYGFYIDKIVEHADADEIPSDSTFYINYTGRLLNGQVFDTTIEDTAKVYNIYSSSKTYAPVSITKGSTYAKTSMGTSSSSVITGFGSALHLMKPYEKAITAFTSSLGYGYRGSGSAIPGYMPLCFEIELVDKPEE